MSKADPDVLSALGCLIDKALAECVHRPVVIGLCGAQGSGKTTLAAEVIEVCARRGIAAASLSIDDLYLTGAQRRDLAGQVHPLLQTRGPPGTHDCALGFCVFESLERGEKTPLPRFDKALDDRAPQNNWPFAPSACEVLIFEGWCVGALPQEETALLEPVNELEACHDPDGVWRRYVNASLAGEYQRLFARIDKLVLLAAPGFDVVHGWRLQQEQELSKPSGRNGKGVMDETEIGRFIQHYERLTRHVLDEMPCRADLLVKLDESRVPVAIEKRVT